MSSLAYLWPVVRDADLSFLISCAATALTFYEHLITIRLEVQQIWRREASVATALFVATRYINVLDRLFAILGLYPIRDVISCSTVLWLQAATSSILIAVMSAIAAIRIFALWGRDYRFLIIVLLTGFFPAFASLFFRNASSVYIIPTRIYTCQSFPTAMTAVTFKSLSIATRVIAIFSDGLVAVLTWVKTYQIYTLSKGARFRANYSALLLRDGAVYFMAVCILNFIAIMYIVMTGTNLLNDLIVTLSSILMARFLLNLRDERARVETLSFAPGGTTKLTVLSGLSSVRFASDAFDSMGGSVSVHAGVDSVHAEDDDDDGEEDPDGDRSIESEKSTCVGSLEDLNQHKKGAIEWA